MNATTAQREGGIESHPWLLAFGGVLVIAAGVAAILLANMDEGERVEPAVVLDPPRSAGQEALAVGPMAEQLAPDFEVSDLDGGRHRLSAFRGRAVYLTFWATWCLPCTTGRILNEGGLLPDLQVLQEQHGEELAIVVVNRGESVAEVQTYLERVRRADGGTGVSFTVNAIDPDDTLFGTYGHSAFGETGMPASFFIDANGVIKIVHDRRGDLKSIEEGVATTLASGR